MGVCHTNNKISDNYNKIKIDGLMKDLTTDYLFDNSIKTPIRNDYTFEDTKIGQGSFGYVVKGTDKFGKLYAIKIIRKNKIFKGQLLANEIRLGMMMDHPNILGIKEIYEDLKTISFVMDYCEGGDLLDFIIRHPEGKLDDINTLDIIIQILSALDYLHNQIRICHRDIKPDNFLITVNEQNRPIVKLIDFGFAHYISRNVKLKGRIGTIMYMAPEIIMEKPYDEKVDLWSAGVILFNLITGGEPFSQSYEQFKKIEMQILNKPINFDKIKNNGLRQLCQEMMERDPEKRIDARTALEKAKMIKVNMINS